MVLCICYPNKKTKKLIIKHVSSADKIFNVLFCLLHDCNAGRINVKGETEWGK